jgi:hypothetical protein
VLLTARGMCTLTGPAFERAALTIGTLADTHRPASLRSRTRTPSICDMAVR